MWLPCAACRRLAGCRRQACDSERFACQAPQASAQLNAPQVQSIACRLWHRPRRRTQMTSHAWSCILAKYWNGTDQSSIHPARFDYSSKVTIPISHTQTKTSSRATITTGSSSKVSITNNFIKLIKFTKKAQRNQNLQLPLAVTWLPSNSRCVIFRLTKMLLKWSARPWVRALHSTFSSSKSLKLPRKKYSMPPTGPPPSPDLLVRALLSYC